jgi:serine/threonine protein kinase
MAPEQAAGKPQHNSDIYAVSMIGIQALTGLPPSQLKSDSQTGEIRWQEKASVSSGLAVVLSKMARYDCTKRYQSAIETLQALKKLSNFTMLQLNQEFITPSAEEEMTAETRIWAEGFGAEELPPTEPPPT